MFFTGIIATLGIILLVYKIQKRLELLKKLEGFNGPKGWPILGNCLELFVPRKDVIGVLEAWTREHGGCVLFFLGFHPYFLVTSPDDMEKVLSSQVVIEKSSDYKAGHPWVRLGLLTAGGEKWFHRRKQLTPAFHFKILEDFLKVFNEQCGILRSVFESKENLTFDMFPVITLCALDIICETAMGKKINAQKKSDSEFIKALIKMSELIRFRQLRPWLSNDLLWRLSPAGKEEKRCLKILHGCTNTVIKEKKGERKRMGQSKTVVDNKIEEDDIYMGSSKKKRLAFLDLLLDAQDTDPNLTDLNIREETDTFMMAGHDTTAAAVNWTTFLIATYPEIQKKVQEELDEIFGEDRKRNVNMEDLTKMKYLECCIKESLRVYPSVPFIGRLVTKDLELSRGLVAPKGTTIFLSIYGLHRNEKIFPNPDNFDPDRFRMENTQGRHPYAYVPFSAGPRNCIGQKFAMMEVKVMLSSIFRNFTVEAMEKREDIAVLCELITRPENGLKVQVKRRHYIK